MTKLFIDFETRSMKELRGPNSVGLSNYCEDPSTEAIILAYAFDEGDPGVWFPLWQPMPAVIEYGLEQPDFKLVAYNSAFERNILKHILGFNLPVSRFDDPQPSARYLSLPGSLDEVGEILNLPEELRKNKEGKRLIDIFTKPTKKKGLEPYFRDWDSDPEDWQRFVEYAKQDIRAEREILKRLEAVGCFPLPENERRIWELDQKINDRGIPVDRPFVQSMFNLGEQAKKDAIGELKRLTGLENANSNSQMLKWAQKEGYGKQSLRKETVLAELKFNTELTPLCRQVLELRKAASSTSYKKMGAILRLASSDNRLKNQFIYMGSSRCGRWSGNGYQFQNQPRAAKEFEDPDVINEARQRIKGEDYQGIISRFGKNEKDFGAVLNTVKSCIRTSFHAEPGKTLNVCDLNAIETRVGAWMTGCNSLLQVFFDGLDPYLAFAVNLSGQSYNKLAKDIKSPDSRIKTAAKDIRQWAKAGVLQCIYRASGGELRKNKHGDTIRTGLWGFITGMGIEITQEKSAEIVRVFRDSYPEICQFWYDAEDAVFDVLKGQRTKRQLGPDGCIKIDKIEGPGVYPILRVQLPSGRYIHYFDARIEDCKMPWKAMDDKGELTVDVWKPGLVYANVDQETKQWGTAVSHGGKLMENWDQGISRDVLAHYLLEYEKAGIPICLHVHDEGGSETDRDIIKIMQEMMKQSIWWAPGLPLSGEGWSGPYYKKG